MATANITLKPDKQAFSLIASMWAEVAHIEGMKAENACRACSDDSPAFGSGHFEESAQQLRVLADLLRKEPK